MDSNISELVKLGHERADELKAACCAVDVRSVAQLISDLASQLEVQYVRAEESQREFRSADITMQNLEAKCEKLAAENAGLNKFIVESCFVQSGEVPSWHQAIDHAPETPATDAFLAEVRAQARTDFIGRIEWIIRNECNPEKTETILNELQSFSETVSQESAQ